MASPFGWDLGKLETFVESGVRQIQLADGRRNFIADTCWETSNVGLSAYGFEVIEAFNGRDFRRWYRASPGPASPRV